MTPGSAVEEPSGSLGAAIARAARLLESDAAQAGDQANEILQVFPANRDARLILGASLRAQDRLEEAVAVLSKLAAAEPAWPEARLALGRTLMKQGALAPAIEAYRAAAELAPLKPEAWRALADALHRAGRLVEADAAYMEGVRVSASDPRLVQAADALLKNDIPQAEHLLRTHLKKYPTDIAAMRMLAEVAARLKRYAQAETLLARCLELAPSFHAARHNCAMVLHMQAKSAEALAHIEILLAREPENPSLRALKAAALVRIGDYDEALAIYAALRDEIPDDPGPWLSYGHALKTTGRQAESIAAYRKCVALAPQFGEAYWSLANLKTFAFAPEEIAAMRKALTAPNLSREDEFHLHFALGKALEDAGQHAESFAHYAKGNALRRALIHYEADETSAMLAQSKQVFTAPFFAARQGWGAEAADPIFVVGLPRAGSTLIEQILASHSLVEGTMELPDLPAIVKSFGERRRKDETPKYPAAVRSEE
ncbi:MAG: tetratricopeptide repeat protein, partial [Hyphomonadaceae bacterium]